jgi:Beta-lactamase class C and other penicillin binding proteins
MARALAGNHASPHAWDIDGHPAVGRIDFNYTIMPYRPAGGAWSSAHDLIKYVQLELNQGRLPSGQQLVSAKNLLARRAPNVPLGEDGSYGMGLEEEHSTGVSVVHHGGSMAGYKSDWLALPGAGVGAVLLTNADEGQSLLTPFKRRLLELLYDGEPQAATNIQAVATNSRAAVAKERPKLKLPAAPESASELAAHYTNPALGHIDVRHEGANVTFDFGLWHSRVATRVNEDSTVAFVTVDPTVDGFAFIAGTRDGKRTLLLRDAQHEYLYTEAR